VEAKITSRTKAILPVHLYGHPADLDRLLLIARRRNLLLIEDCAQAHGAEYRGRRVGSLGHAGCFSFYPTKNLGAYGDGGMVVTNDATIAKKLRLLREYGWEERYVSSVRGGMNSRLDELQATILRVKLRHLEEWTRARRMRAGEYTELLAGSGALAAREMGYARHVYHLYVVRSRQRVALSSFLKERGVGTGIHYPVPVHLQPGYADLGRGVGSFPVTEQLAQEILSLPMFPELTAAETQQVGSLVRLFGAQ